MKKLTKEILIIILISTVLALAYNFFSSSPLPWLREEVKIETVDDSLLIIPYDTVAATSSSNDTAKTAEKPDTTEKEEIVKEEIVKDSVIKKAEQKKVSEEIVSGGTEGDVKTLSFEQVKKHQKNPGFLFIDARPEHEWQEAHIGNAVNILPPYDGDMDKYFKKLMALPKDKIIVVYCTGGTCESSHKVASDLIAFGFPKVFLYSGGWDEWTKKQGSK